ncbi:MAG: hypothetical protein JRC77_04665 [Deltaproteobacteria bacterium]|nr:hypothetical protein [Deltaproteobacteria bacterium]
MRSHPRSLVCFLTRFLGAVAVLTLLGLVTTHPAIAKEWEPEVVQISLPPDSIAQWYKPQNKRQVWLHLMFRLRTDMGAIELYAESGNKKKLVKWAEALEKNYAKIPEMVPEWSSEVDLKHARALRKAAKAGNLEKVRRNATQLRKTCNRCHQQWGASTAALYRSPDFSNVTLVDSRSRKKISYAKAMRKMSRSLVKLKVARTDGNFKTAREAAIDIEKRLHDLGTSCAECHDDKATQARYLGTETFDTMKALRSSLTKAQDPKLSRQHLRTLGADICGSCHGAHRTLSDLRNQLVPKS